MSALNCSVDLRSTTAVGDRRDNEMQGMTPRKQSNLVSRVPSPGLSEPLEVHLYFHRFALKFQGLADDQGVIPAISRQP